MLEIGHMAFYSELPYSPRYRDIEGWLTWTYFSGMTFNGLKLFGWQNVLPCTTATPDPNIIAILSHLMYADGALLKKVSTFVP